MVVSLVPPIAPATSVPRPTSSFATTGALHARFSHSLSLPSMAEVLEVLFIVADLPPVFSNAD
jgi:hypothetical protein